MAISIPSQILGMLKEIASLGKTYYATRESAYIRKMDKRQRKTIEYGEKIIHRLDDLGVEDKEIEKLKKKFMKYHV